MLQEADNKYAVVRDRLTELVSGEDEREYDYATELSAEIAKGCGGAEKEKKTNPTQKDVDSFLALSTR